LLQAKQNEIEAGRAYVETLRDYWKARAELEKAVGGQLGASERAAQSEASAIPANGTPQHQHGD
jgi:cobalt-zinc-cadmium efflux system outer membrane protein